MNMVHTCGSLYPRHFVKQISLGFGQNQMLGSCVYYKVCKFSLYSESYPGLREEIQTPSPQSLRSPDSMTSMWQESCPESQSFLFGFLGHSWTQYPIFLQYAHRSFCSLRHSLEQASLSWSLARCLRWHLFLSGDPGLFCVLCSHSSLIHLFSGVSLLL